MVGDKKNVGRDDLAKLSLREFAGHLRPGAFRMLVVSVVSVIVVMFGAGAFVQRYVLHDEPIRVTQPKKSDRSSVLSAGALIIDYRNDEYVMLGVLHAPEGRGIVFSPPGGSSETGEGPIKTAIRETLEETGYTLTNVEFLERAPAGNPNFSLVSAEVDSTVSQVNYTYDRGVGIIWANPSRVPPSGWRFPEQRTWVIDRFEELVRSSSLKQ